MKYKYTSVLKVGYMSVTCAFTEGCLSKILTLIQQVKEARTFPLNSVNTVFIFSGFDDFSNQL